MELSKPLKGRMALVTGSSSGVGAVIAEELAAQGASIIVNGRDPHKVGSMRDQLEEICRVQTYACVADGTNNESVCAGIAQLFPNRLDHLDILVNNVGGLEKFGSFETLTDEDWMRAYDLNCLSAVRFTRHTLPWLKKSKFPRIINISTVSTRQMGNNNPHYNIGKVGLNYVTKYLALHLAEWQILVNAILPSTMNSGEWEENIQHRAKRCGMSLEAAAKKMRQEEEKKSPLGRMNSAKDMGKLTVFLASDENQFISGALIPLDGATNRTLF